MDFFESAYKGTPPWDIGRPQKEFIDLVRRGELSGSVLDIGCGTGENALFFAGEGYEVWGIDSAPLAIQKAREKAAGRGLAAHFLVMDALDLPSSTESLMLPPIRGSSIPCPTKTAPSSWTLSLLSSPLAGNT